MKKKNFRISRTTLFVFQTSKEPNQETTTSGQSDPTTTMITTTVSGIWMPRK